MCLCSLQDKRAVHLGHYQVELEKLRILLDLVKEHPEPLPHSAANLAKQRKELENFWKVERERAFIAGLSLWEKKGKVLPQQKRQRGHDQEESEINTKRRRMTESLLLALQPACIQRDYRAHEPGPLFPEVYRRNHQQGFCPEGDCLDILRQGSVEKLRSIRSSKYIQNNNAERIWLEKINDLCKKPEASKVANIRAELTETRGKIRKALPKHQPKLRWQTDNIIFTEIKRKQKLGRYSVVPKEITADLHVPRIRWIPISGEAVKYRKAQDMDSWIELDDKDTERLKTLQS